MAIAVPLLLAALGAAFRAEARLLPAQLRLCWEHEMMDMAPIDFDGDSTDELLALGSEIYAVGYNQKFEVASRSWTFKAGTHERGAFVGGINKDTMWVAYVRHDSAFVYDLRREQEILVAAGTSLVEPGWWDGGIVQVELHDLNGDGKSELVAAVTTGFALRPRGIVAIDWSTGRRLWYYEMGPNPSNFLVGDVDGDGKSEVIVGSTAPGNRPPGYSPPDTLTYVSCVGRDGREKWRRCIGYYGQQARIAWFGQTDSGRQHVLVSELGCAIEGAQPDSLFLLNGPDSTLLRSAQYGPLNSACAVFADRAGRQSLALAGTDGALRILDDTLHLRRKLVLHSGHGTAIQVGRFTDKRHDQLLVQTSSGRVVLYDSRFRPLADSLVGDGQVRIVRNGGLCRILVGWSSGRAKTVRLYEVEPVPASVTRIVEAIVDSLLEVAPKLVAALALLGIVGATFWALRRRQARRLRDVIDKLTKNAGVIQITPQGGLSLNRNAQRMLGKQIPHGTLDDLPKDGPFRILAKLAEDTLSDAPSSPPRVAPVYTEPGGTYLVRAYRLESQVVETIEDITRAEYVQRIAEWAPVAQKLAHDIKNPLTVMALTLQRLAKHRTPETERYYTSMKDEIDRLKKMADGFMRLSKLEPPKLARTAINEVVRQCAGKFEGVKPAGVELRYDLAEGLPSVALDRDQMAVACSNIIENAISAIVGSGIITIRTSYIVEDKKVDVVVQDTGKGIPERYLDEVCEPFFALKPGGTGLGMAITKRIIDDHKGTIRIESKEGVGTTVTIELPVVTSDA